MILRPYQAEVAKTVLDSVQHHRGLTLSVEVARQGGKNELSAHLEVLLLTIYSASGGTIVKCSPTFKPQTIISMQRLKDRLDGFGLSDFYHTEMGYIIRLAAAQAVFLSADESASVVGHTADLLLEIDESQDVSKEKYTKEFRPMGSSTNVTTVHYGTTWDDTTLLEEIKQSNIELQKTDGIQRHFRYDWQVVARENPYYREYVESERDRLGADHPLFRTQYALLPIIGGGRFLTREQIIGMTGQHAREKAPADTSARYVAGVDIAGEQETDRISALTSATRKQDATVITIAQVEQNPQRSSLRMVEPTLKVVEQYHWTGTPHSQVFHQMLSALQTWDCRRIAVDATGIGQPVASYLKKELGARVKPFVFTQRSKSDMGFEMLAMVNAGRLRLYKQDGSKEYQETMFELEKARADYKPNQTVNFYVDESDGHDDFLMSLALTVQALQDYKSGHVRVVQRQVI